MQRKDSFRKWMEKKGIERWFQRDNLIILVLSGILLFIIALPTKDSETKAGEPKRQTGSGLFGAGGDGAEDIADGGFADEEFTDGAKTGGASYETAFPGDDYCAYLEGKLTKTLADMAGVGSVHVMITLKSSEEVVVEKDIPITRSATNETDSQGGSRIVNQSDTAETTVYRTNGSSSEPYVIKTLLPEVEGVLVVAQGAESSIIKKNITEIVQALFDIEAHKIKVVKMETSN